MQLQENQTVGQVVTENIKASHVFKKHGIDFCCGGGISIEKACEKYKVDIDILLNDLQQIDQQPNRNYDYNNWELGFLLDHIIHVHHSFVKEQLPILLQYSEKVAKVHGHHYTEVLKINELFEEIAAELSSHLQKEEQILFPYIKLLVQLEKEGKIVEQIPFGTVNNPIAMMEEEHESAGTIFKEIAILTNNYTPHPEACNTFKALYAGLKEFEEDLHQHIHLENNIVHPKAIALENKLKY